MYSSPPTLNFEYVIVRGQDFFSSWHIGGWPHGALVFLEDVIIVGMILSLLLIVFTVYALIRLYQVEHAGFHAKEAHAHEEHVEHQVHEEHEVEATHTNERWDNIAKLAYGTSEGDWRRAILEADIMLFDTLATQGYPGTSVGEQLKNANPIQMSTLDLAWKAHKMRNDVAHSGEKLPLAERDVRSTIDYYKRVFEEFGVI